MYKIKLSVIKEISEKIYKEINEKNNLDPGLFYKNKLFDIKYAVGKIVKILFISIYIINEKLAKFILKIQPCWGAHDQSVKIQLAIALNNSNDYIENFKKLNEYKIKFEHGIGFSTPFKFDDAHCSNVSYAHTCCWAFDAYYEMYKKGIIQNLIYLDHIVSHLARDFKFFNHDDNSESIYYSTNSELYDVINVSADVALVFLKWLIIRDGILLNRDALIYDKYIRLMNFVLSNVSENGQIPYRASQVSFRNIDPYHSLMVLRCIVHSYIHESNFVNKELCITIAHYIRNNLFSADGDPRASLYSKYPSDSYSYAELLRLLNELKGTNIFNEMHNIFNTCISRLENNWIDYNKKLFITKKLYFFNAKHTSFRWAQGYLACELLKSCYE